MDIRLHRSLAVGYVAGVVSRDTRRTLPAFVNRRHAFFQAMNVGDLENAEVRRVLLRQAPLEISSRRDSHQ